MSISTKSYESIIKLTTAFYDQSMPLYYVPEYLEMIYDIILLLLQKKTIKIATTTEILPEPIVENKNIIYISIPLVARLINEPVELPKNVVDFIDGTKFDIFHELDYGVRNEDSRNRFASCMRGEDPDGAQAMADFTPNERIRFTQMLRIIIMCSHFYEHYINKLPYIKHTQSLKQLEVAVQKKLNATVEAHIDRPINYEIISNL